MQLVKFRAFLCLTNNKMGYDAEIRLILLIQEMEGGWNITLLKEREYRSFRYPGNMIISIYLMLSG